MDDVRKYIYGALIMFVTGVLVWVGIVFVNACGLNFSCPPGAALVDRTPIPSLIPATLPVSAHTDQMEFNKCKLGAVTLLGDWVSAGYPEKDAFSFTDMNGQNCEATYEKDIQPLLMQSGLWYSNSLSCTSCHNADMAETGTKFDISTYQGMLLGSGRADANAKGSDIFGSGNWEKSRLYDLLVKHSTTPPGHPANVPVDGPIIYVGQPIKVLPAEIPATEAPVIPTATP